MIRILLVEDNAVVRKGLAGLLEAEQDIEVSATAANGIEALRLLENGLPVDIIVTDLNMPGIDGISLTRQLLKNNWAAQVIILTMHGHSAFLNNALAAGAKGYLLKGGDIEDLFSGIRTVHSGGVYISTGIRPNLATS